MIYLLSYSPLANSLHGRAVAARNGIPPYVDASCRREPDFELASPFISGLCRPAFIPTLEPLDIIVYVTNKRKIHPEGRRLVAVLKLVQEFNSHQSAAAAYKAEGQRLPSSCVVPGNPPLPIEMTDPTITRKTRKFTDSNIWSRAVYVPRAKQCVRCFACESLFLELRTPPTVDDDYWNRSPFGGDPGKKIRNWGLALDSDDYDALLRHVGIQLTEMR